MSASAHSRWDDTLAAYLLGALPGDELEEFGRHLAECERCRDEAVSLQVAVDVLAVAVPPVVPPEALKARVMNVVDSEAELLAAAGSGADRPDRRARRRTGLRRWFPRPVITAGATAAALAVGVLAGIAIVGGNDGSGGQRTVAAQVNDRGAAAARASLVVDGTRAKLVVRQMPAPASGRVYQVWVKRAGAAPVPAGTTFMLRSGVVSIPRPVRNGDQVLVTSEPSGGSPAPTRSPIVVAQPV
jgi:anti-sigma-K factor RskA